MTRPSPLQIKFVKLTQVVAHSSLILLSGSIAMAQSQQMEEKLMALKENQAANKQKLAQYTWQETETISIKGSVKDTKVYGTGLTGRSPASWNHSPEDVLVNLLLST